MRNHGGKMNAATGSTIAELQHVITAYVRLKTAEFCSHPHSGYLPIVRLVP